MARLLSIFFLFYLLAFVGLRFFILASGTHTDQVAIRTETDLVSNSARHDFKRIRVKGSVIQSGHYFWDLLLIPSYSLKTSGGLRMHVFAKGAVPAIGSRLEMVGVFRQYYQGSYGQWLGMVELERGYLDVEIPSAQLNLP
jgi:hypothetical protein